MGAIRVQVNDWQTASGAGKGVLVGKGFLFLGPKAFEAPGLAWIPRLFRPEGPVPPRVVSLLGTGAVSLLGVTIQPATPPAVHLRSVTCDRAIYREGRDVVRLLLLDLLAPGAERVVEVDLNGTSFGRYPVTLDGRGAALFELRDLPAGDYRARVQGAGGEDCSFTVAVYRLAPLVASLVERRMEGSAKLWARLRLEAYGAPVDGPVIVEITDQGSRAGRERVEARAGFAEVTLPLTGEGPHALNVQLASDSSRTATVPLVGSRAFEREQTLFSTLGAEVLGALLPGENSRPVRGIFLEEGAHRTSPFTLERIDATRARLRAMATIEHACFVILDPTFPRRRDDAIDMATATHPAHEDQAYVRGEKLFHQGKFVEAKALFELGLSARPVAHPNYAYFVACCHARLGNQAQAVASLRTAIEHGWNDWEHLRGDEDLASLRGYAPFEALLAGGRREISMESLVSGQEIQIEGFGPLSLLAVGAFVDGTAWEGWAALLAPEQLQARIVAPEIPSPGAQVRIDVEVGEVQQDASVYLLVKDARLLSPDTPLNRVAARLKGCVAEAGKLFGAGTVTQELTSLITPPPVAAPHPDEPPPMPIPRFRAAPGGAIPRASHREMLMEMAPAWPMALRMLASSVPAARASVQAASAPLVAGWREEAPTEAGASMSPRAVATEEPEILFAGLIEARDGQASATVTLGPAAADYIVEAFVLSGLQWTMSEVRFRAEKVPSVALEVPPFVHPGDTALGRAVVNCASGRMRVRVLRDGAPVPLLFEGRELAAGEELAATSAELSFLTQPGVYEAVVEDLATGAADWVRRIVDVPGTFRRLTRTVRLLSAGEEMRCDQEPGLLGLRVLPGLDQPFTALIDATADYGHACCEQTAAKMMAASGMYLFAGDDSARRARAEAILLAGVRRERTMWLRGRGFKMYPESADVPSDYWSPKAAMHLWFLAAVRDAAVAPSRALLQGLEECLEMAADVTRAHRIPWPPTGSSSAEEAYRTLRFGADRGAQERALTAARARASAPGAPENGAVAHRVELAYAAAALLRGRQQADLPLALRLANQVTRAFNASGRLYSTVDSVAAIVLMAELTGAGVVGGAGLLQVNGQRLSSEDAASYEGEIREVKVLQGVAAVEESRLVEERWGGLQMNVPLRFSLERGGRPAKRLAAGDDVALRVTLEGGYKEGDLLWVCLPDALSRILGGGQLKLFSVDFEGKREVLVPLAVTGLTLGADGSPTPQRFAICVRNMFEEERAGNPGPLEVLVEGPDGASGLGRLVRGLKSFFGS
jgi:hypothetical protein